MTAPVRPPAWTVDAVADAAGGRLDPADATGTVLTGPATIDSRRVGAGDLFVAV